MTFRLFKVNRTERESGIRVGKRVDSFVTKVIWKIKVFFGMYLRNNPQHFNHSPGTLVHGKYGVKNWSEISPANSTLQVFFEESQSRALHLKALFITNSETIR